MSLLEKQEAMTGPTQFELPPLPNSAEINRTAPFKRNRDAVELNETPVTNGEVIKIIEVSDLNCFLSPLSSPSFLGKETAPRRRQSLALRVQPAAARGAAQLVSTGPVQPLSRIEELSNVGTLKKVIRVLSGVISGSLPQPSCDGEEPLPEEGPQEEGQDVPDGNGSLGIHQKATVFGLFNVKGMEQKNWPYPASAGLQLPLTPSTSAKSARSLSRRPLRGGHTSK